jgi:phosphate transport system substrate-binding protein
MGVRTIAIALAAGLIVVAAAADARARSEITVVGGTLLEPLAEAVGKAHAKSEKFAEPQLQMKGTGAGLKAFCGGIGAQFPDIAATVRKMKDAEIDQCTKSGIKAITTIKIGYDAVVLINRQGTRRLSLTAQQIWTALAKEVPVNGQMTANPYKMWNEIDPSLPAAAIQIFAPSTNHGTWEAFAQMILKPGCEAFPEIKARDEEARKAICDTMRDDGVLVDFPRGPDDVTAALDGSAVALGITGFGSLARNREAMQSVIIDGVEPTEESIVAGDYLGWRAFYIMVKNAHLDIVPGIANYLASFVSDEAIGEDGYLMALGLIPLPADERQAMQKEAAALAAASN